MPIVFTVFIATNLVSFDFRAAGVIGLAFVSEESANVNSGVLVLGTRECEERQNNG